MKTEQDTAQYLLDQVARLTAENAMLKEKWLAQPEQEPVAWITEWVQRYRHNDTPIMDRAVSFTKGDAPAVPNPNYIPLYTSELLAQPEPEQQPEAWIIVNKETGYRTQVSDLTPFLYHREIFEVIPLYTAPPKREPLSDEERQRISKAYSTRAEQLAFEEGIIFAKILYGIGGGE